MLHRYRDSRLLNHFVKSYICFYIDLTRHRLNLVWAKIGKGGGASTNTLRSASMKSEALKHIIRLQYRVATLCETKRQFGKQDLTFTLSMVLLCLNIACNAKEYNMWLQYIVVVLLCKSMSIKTRTCGATNAVTPQMATNSEYQYQYHYKWISQTEA